MRTEILGTVQTVTKHGGSVSFHFILRPLAGNQDIQKISCSHHIRKISCNHWFLTADAGSTLQRF